MNATGNINFMATLLIYYADETACGVMILAPV